MWRDPSTGKTAAWETGVPELSPAEWGGVGEEAEVPSRRNSACTQMEPPEGRGAAGGRWGLGGWSRGPRTGDGRHGKLRQGPDGYSRSEEPAFIHKATGSHRVFSNLALI